VCVCSSTRSAIINSAATMLNHKVRTTMTTTTIIRNSRMHPHANGQNFAVADRFIRAANDNFTRLLPKYTSSTFMRKLNM